MQLVKLLETARADVNAKDEHGMTPLHKAAVQGHIETASELLSHGAHVDAKLTVRGNLANMRMLIMLNIDKHFMSGTCPICPFIYIRGMLPFEGLFKQK